jgi:hypothetical protein
MTQLETLYGLTVSKHHSTYELLATSADDPRIIWGRWQFESAEQLASTLSRLDMSAVDYLGVDQQLTEASTVQVGHAIKGSLLIGVLGIAGKSG